VYFKYITREKKKAQFLAYYTSLTELLSQASQKPLGKLVGIKIKEFWAPM